MIPAINNPVVDGLTESADAYIVHRDDLILITGSNGFIGPHVIESFMALGFRNLRCFVRSANNISTLTAQLSHRNLHAGLELVRGNLLSVRDCVAATDGAHIIVHLAAGRGEKSFPDAYLNSVVTTRNLLDATLRQRCLRRFVNVSSFSVYANTARARSAVLDEECPLEEPAYQRGEAYCFAKIKQDLLIKEYGRRFSIPYVIVRPGYVYGPGKHAISGRVGVDTFGVFLHLGGSNKLPFTYVRNCADAIALAAVKPGVDGEVFNVVDDELPSSRRFLSLYKKHVRRFRSVYVPHALSYLLCWLWERYAAWSEDQLPPVFNRSRWHANWKKTVYSNERLKTRLGWKPGVSTSAGLAEFFAACRRGVPNA